MLAALLPAVTAHAATTATVYCKPAASWIAVNIHHAPAGGSRTTTPGLPMTAACAGLYKRTVDLGMASGLAATFNNGSGTWDNHGGANHQLGTGTITVRDGAIAHSDPCGSTQPPQGNAATVRYSAATVGWTTVNLHWAPTGGSWTTAPGTGMEPACTGWVKKTVDLGAATTWQATFNNGNGVWDNNNSANYQLGNGNSTVRPRPRRGQRGARQDRRGRAVPAVAPSPDTGFVRSCTRAGPLAVLSPRAPIAGSTRKASSAWRRQGCCRC
ncbi:carbohydrate binding domain-containing protein [Streptomyces tanashiensis]|uniref:carbohydrate binding domain-containing protein n=1 Tax=Streptomyces tanashiensis TaxID=67367 RepID=UPI0036CF114A